MKGQEAPWNLRECAEFLGRSEGQVRLLVREGEIPHLIGGRAPSFRPEDVKKWALTHEADRRLWSRDDDHLWTPADCAEYLACSPKTVRRLVHKQEIPHLYVGSILRFRPEAVRKWVLEQEIDWSQLDAARMERRREEILRSIGR